MKGPERDDTPVLITAAEPSYEQQYADRKRKYLVMMGMRIPLLILAAFFHDPWWVAVVLVLISIPLPWAAVLIANDRPARKAEKVSRYRSGAHEPTAIENTGHEVIEG